VERLQLTLPCGCGSSVNMDVDVGGRYEPAVNQDAELCVTGSNQQNTDVTETLETEPTAIDWNDVLENVQVRLVRPHAGCAIAV